MEVLFFRGKWHTYKVGLKEAMKANNFNEQITRTLRKQFLMYCYLSLKSCCILMVSTPLPID